MKLSTIYRKAARELHENPEKFDCMCNAIGRATSDYRAAVAAIDWLNSVFEADARKAGAHQFFWGENWGKKYARQKPENYDLEEAKRCCVLALLFMAAMAELEEKK